MSEAIRKPYELSLWADILETSPDDESKSYYKEIKVATIGSDTMTAPNRAFDVVLKENINGEKTLTFSLRQRYFDIQRGEIVENPFTKYLNNERKIKLHYNNNWYDFVLKEAEETSEEYVFSYTAKDLFTLELAKVGYNVTFDAELNNNQGTVTELAKKTLEQTDWIVDEDNSDLLKQTIKEPLYECTITQLGANFDVLNVDTNKDMTSADFDANETIYIFYSYITNKSTKFIQFIREKDRDNFEFDSENIITSTNYRIKKEAKIYGIGIEKVEDSSLSDGQIYLYPHIYKNGTEVTDIIKRYDSYLWYKNDEGAPTTGDVDHRGRIVASTDDSYKLTFELTDEDYGTINLEVTTDKEQAEIIVVDDTRITVNKTYNKNQAYRLVYGQRTTFDPVMNRTVKIYRVDQKGGSQDIYNYTDAQYITSSILTSFITSGNNFSALEDGTIQGWSHLVPTSTTKGIPEQINITTRPVIDKVVDLNKIQNFANITGYLELKFPAKYDRQTGQNAYFNTGIEDNVSAINHIAAGEKFVLRLKCGRAAERNKEILPFDPTQSSGVRAVIAKYEVKNFTYKDADGEDVTEAGYHILNNSIILDFNGDFEEANSYIDGGIFNSDFTNYIVDNVVQTPSTKYCYRTEGDSKVYIWDGTQNKYVEKGANYLNYYATTATARMSFSTEMLSDPLTRIGIFLYTEDSNFYGDNYTFIEDIQITRCFRDANDKLVTLGNVPESKTIEIDYYYLKPLKENSGEATNLYSSLQYLALENGLVADDIYPVYNEDCEKILSIQEEHSNCFNILQSLCETFECWLKIDVKHTDEGAIYLDSNKEPVKTVAFKEYIGKENFAGIKYGINLNSISRTVDSNEIVTKLIVENVSSEYTGSGSLSIADAPSNRNKDSYILNFSHYLNTNLIQDRDSCEEDVNKFYEEIEKLNREIYDTNKKKVELLRILDISKANLNTLETLLSEAKLTFSKAKADFEKSTFDPITNKNVSYEEFVKRYNAGEEAAKKILESDTIVDIIGEIYNAAIVSSNYEGIVHNLREEYVKQQFETYGAKAYDITITTAPAEEGTGYITTFVIDDYISGLDFNLVRPKDGDILEYSSHFVSSLNERIFTVVIEDNAPITHCIFNVLPANYKLEYYKNNELHSIGQKSNIDFVIYDPTQPGIVTRKYKLTPEEEWTKNHPNLDKILEKATEKKKSIEKDFYKKYSRFIQEGTWSSQDYVDPELYYLDALQVSRTSSQPQVTYDIKVSEISELEGYGNYFFEVGDKTYIEDENFFGTITTIYNGNEFITPVKEEIVISEVEWHLDEPNENTVTVQNYKTQFEDLFQRISATVQTVQYNEVKYPKISSVLNSNGLLDPDLLLKSWNSSEKNGYNLTSNGNVTIDTEGILVQDLTKTSNLVRIESRGIKTSPNGGQDWFSAIDGFGVNADALTAGTINTQNVWLMDGANPSFRWDKSGISAYGFKESSGEEGQLYDYGTYVRLDKYGLYGVKDGENYVASSLDNIKDKASFGLTWDGFFIKNSYTNGYVSISSDDDFQVVTDNEEQEIYIPVETLEEIELSSFENKIDFPYDHCSIVKVLDSTGAEVEFTYENKIIGITGSDGTFTIKYIHLLNTIDLGGRGIIKINSIDINYQSYEGEYTFNRETGILTLPFELKAGDYVVVNYELERIKIGATKFVDGAPSKYGIEVRNRLGETVFETNDEGNLSVTGTINATDGVFKGTVYAQDGEFSGHIRATSGVFAGSVTVGEEKESYITINGEEALPFIASSNYINSDQEGWIINAEGDATFNNINVRGSIKTSVFEQGEIQTVGGAFMFRPSDSIERAELRETKVEIEGEISIRYDLVLTMKLGGQFKVGDLCKLGEIINLIQGLKAIYEIIEVSEDGKTIVLEGAGEIFKDRI